MNDLLKLQNGSDIRGIALEGVAGEDINLTPETAKCIAAAFGIWLKNRTGKSEITVAVGRDSRLSGESLALGVMSGLCVIDAKVYNFGFASTPSMYMCTIDKKLNCDGAIMLTASHLPFNRNGLKFFTKDGGTDKSDIYDILTTAKNLDLRQGMEYCATEYDFLSEYAENLKKLIQKKTNAQKPFAGTKIIVDAGNGVGGFFADKILAPLGADVLGSVYLEPDGNFPNHIPNPELASVMDSFKQTVIRKKADLGIIFDTDVDRAAIVDGNGLEINRNRLVALMSAIVIHENPGTTIVTDSITNQGLKTYIESLGGKHHRFKRGYKNVINEARRLNNDNTDCALAIETSGHCALRENYFLDDGAYMIVKILIKFSQLKNQSLSDLIVSMEEPACEEEIRVKITVPGFREYADNVLTDFEVLCANTPGVSFEKPNYEGIRINFDKDTGDGWLLMRMSLHDPVMPINYASNANGEKIHKFIYDFLSKYDKLSY